MRRKTKINRFKEVLKSICMMQYTKKKEKKSILYDKVWMPVKAPANRGILLCHSII